MAKILINIPDGLLEEVDQRTREEHMTRSEAIRWALRLWLSSARYVPPIHRPGFAEIEARIVKAAKSNKTSDSAEALIRKDRDSH